MTEIQSYHYQGSCLEYQCEVCEKSFAKKSNLTRHFKKLHGMDPLPKSFKYKCDYCHRQFNNLNQLRYHKRREHVRFGESDKKGKKSFSQHTETDLLHLLEDENFKDEQNTRTPEVKKHECPLCNASFCRPDFPSHFENEHKLSLQVETLEFDSFSDFMEWKAYMEEDTKSNYYKERTSKYGQMNYHYFICNRSGNYKAKGIGVRYLKGQGSCKINAYCPSSIRVQERKDGNCLVSYQKVHVGHQLELRYLHVPSNERCGVTTKITAEMQFDTILDKIHCDSMPGTELKSLQFPTKKDLPSIKNSYLHYQYSTSDNSIGNETCSNESKNEQSFANTKDNQDDFNSLMDFSNEDSEGLTSYFEEENEYEMYLKEKEEKLIQGFTEIVKYASSSEEYNILETALATLKPKIDALRSSASSTLLSTKPPLEYMKVYPHNSRVY